ncbi:hypothetical protein BH09ACT8_BH09ACT8_61310 [soil metagenome]
MRRMDVFTGVVTTAVGAAALWDAKGLSMFGESNVPGPGFFPKILAGLLVFLGLLLVAISVRAQPTVDEDEEAGEVSNSGRLKALAVLVVFAILAPTVEYIGFMPAMVLLVLVVLYGIERRRDFRSLVIAIFIPVACFMLFVHAFSIPLPSGPFLAG